MTALRSALPPETPAAAGDAGRLAVVGYGLIGGSIAQAVQACGSVARVRIWDPAEPARQTAAAQLGADCVASSLPAAVEEADLVLLAVPTSAFAGVLQQILGTAGPTAVLSDVASVKGAIAGIVRDLPMAQRARFVPAHPIAGSEHSGAGHARPDLFRGRQVILTPLAETGVEPVERVRRFWLGIGACVSLMSPQAHDEVFSAVSHLPHLLAFAYLGGLAESSRAHDYAALAGPGFRDFTRIGGADPALWADICVGNRRALLGDLQRFRCQLESLCSALSRGDRAALAGRFAAARALRRTHERQSHPGATRAAPRDPPPGGSHADGADPS